MQRELEQHIQAITGLTPEQRFWVIVKAGLQYLDSKNTPLLPEQSKALRYNPLFWNWWVQLWNTYDLRLVNKVQEPVMDNELKLWINTRTGKLYLKGYISFHKPDSMPYYPNQVVKSLARSKRKSTV